MRHGRFLLHAVGIAMIAGVVNDQVDVAGRIPGAIALLAMIAGVAAPIVLAPKPFGAVIAGLFGARIVLALLPIEVEGGAVRALGATADALGLAGWILFALQFWNRGSRLDRATAVAMFAGVAAGAVELAAPGEWELTRTLHGAIFTIVALLVAAACFARVRPAREDVAAEAREPGSAALGSEQPGSAAPHAGAIVDARAAGTRAEGSRRAVYCAVGAAGALAIAALLTIMVEAGETVVYLLSVAVLLHAVGHRAVSGRAAAIAGVLWLVPVLMPLAAHVRHRTQENLAWVFAIATGLAIIFGAISLFRAPRTPWARAAAWSHVAALPALIGIGMFYPIFGAIFGLMPMFYLTALHRLES